MKDMIHSLQINMLCKLILSAAHSAKGVPTWAERVIRLSDLIISPWIQDFDILYEPVSTILDNAQSHCWAKFSLIVRPSLGLLALYLFVWNTRLRKKLTRPRFDKLSTPPLHNVDITYKGNWRTLAG